jgi:OOP family OmpA-OmpF porin
MKKTALLAALLSLALAGTASAAQAAEHDHGFYAGVGAGSSFVDERNYDDEDVAFSVFAGYQFNRYLGLEAGYADFGELKPRGEGDRLEADSAYLTLVGTLPITERFSAYAKAGVHRWDLDTALPGLTGSRDDNSTDPTYGIGVQYRFNDLFSLRGEYSRFEVDDLDLDLAQVQARFDF